MSDAASRRWGARAGSTLLLLALTACGEASLSGSDVLVLHPLRSPTRDYTIATPQGWMFTPSQGSNGFGTENPIYLSAAGDREATVEIWGMLPISDLAASECLPPVATAATDPQYANKLISCQTSSMTKAWRPSDAVAVIVEYLRRVGVQARSTNVSGAGNSEAQVTVNVTTSGKTRDQSWFLALVTTVNPAWTGLARGYGYQVTLNDTFGFLSLCSAEPGQLRARERECVAVLRSFRPSRGWLSAQLQAYVQNQVNQVQAVLGTVDEIAQMNYETQLEGEAINRKVYEGWWNVLGTSVDLLDPSTGTIYNRQSGHTGYCLNGAGEVVPVDDPQDQARCQTELKPVTPP